MNREDALELLYEHTKTDGLRKHAFAVEAAMGLYAKKLDGDEAMWRITGLLHDFDYEEHPTPEEHPEVGTRLLEDKGYPAEVIYAIRSHAEYLGVERSHLMDKVLFAVDELTGFITAVALVRPSKSVMDVKVKSVKKKMKDKAFARAVSREDIVKGAEELGVALDEHIGTVIEAMQGIAEELGLS